MIKNTLLVILLIVSSSIYSQTKKFSFDINYPYVMDKIPKGIINGGMNFLIKNTEYSKYEISYSISYLNYYYNPLINGTNAKFLDDYIYNHLNLTWKPKIQNLKKTHIFTSAGYSLSWHNYYHKYNEIIDKGYDIDHGFNIKFGLQLDLTKSIYIQSYYHYIMQFYEFDNKIRNFNINHLKFGLGFRL